MTGLSTLPFDLFDAPLTPETPRSPRTARRSPATRSTWLDATRAGRLLGGLDRGLELVVDVVATRRTGRSPARTRSNRSRSMPPVQWPTSTVATELPAKLVSARASDMNRSMPTITPTPSTSSGRCELSPPARVARPAPVTPGGALGGDDHEDQQRDLLADRQRVAERLGDEQRGHGQVDRGAVEVERVAGRHHDADRRSCRRPACSILAISRGSADSEDDVERISRNSRARYLQQREEVDARRPA